MVEKSISSVLCKITPKSLSELKRGVHKIQQLSVQDSQMLRVPPQCDCCCKDHELLLSDELWKYKEQIMPKHNNGSSSLHPTETRGKNLTCNCCSSLEQQHQKRNGNEPANPAVP